MTGFYARLRDARGDDVLLQECIERIVNKIDSSDVFSDKPGMLLGKIQSGKTRAFLGAIARAFDRGFDVAIVLTKGTRTLARQTVQRISHDFSQFIDDDEMVVYDIMEMPERLTPSELRRKIVIVVKKQAKNMERMLDLLRGKYPVLTERKILIVDDEADFTGVRFVKKRGEDEWQQGTIAQQMDDLRGRGTKIAFLQVTATPYALYLQPEQYQPGPDKFRFLPKRPAFTELLPIHQAYVGGDDYFGDLPPGDYRTFLHVEVPLDELQALRGKDGRSIRGDRTWSSLNMAILRRALLTFICSVCVRRWQQKQQDKRQGKFAMIIHNDTQRLAHDWQWEQVEKVREAFEAAAKDDDARLKTLFDVCYEDLKKSVTAHGDRIPGKAALFEDVKALINDGELNAQRVNSDTQLAPILDPNTAELRLRVQANVFIGGSILDRGITVPSLIAFYYGRDPKRMQADTVLQHSRMYGARDHQDLAVTRFYTSRGVRDRLRQIHKLESALRDTLENGSADKGVVFIQTDDQRRIVPCAPGKVSMSHVVTVRPSGIYFPTEFDTVGGPKAKAALATLDERLGIERRNEAPQFRQLSLAAALELLDHCEELITDPADVEFEWGSMRGLLEYFASRAADQVDLLVETDRKLDRQASGDKSGRSIIGGTEVRQLIFGTRTRPALVMLRQEGIKGWSAKRPFWWPLLIAPSDADPCVFSSTESRPKRRKT